jgi:hypothetical protein
MEKQILRTTPHDRRSQTRQQTAARAESTQEELGNSALVGFHRGPALLPFTAAAIRPAWLRRAAAVLPGGIMGDFRHGGGAGGDVAVGGDAEADGGGPAGPLVELRELVPGGGEADAQALGLAEPALPFGLGDAGGEVVAEVGQAWPLVRVDAEDGASNAGPVVIVGLDQDTDPAALSPGQVDAILEKIRTPSLAGGDDVAGEAR